MDNDRKRHGRKKGQSGFTLIELVLSLTIMGFVLGTLATGFGIVGKGWDRGTENASRQDMLIRGINIIRRDIEGLERKIKLSGQLPEFIFTGSRNHLSFIVVEPPFPTRSAPYVINYSVERSTDKTVLVRDRRRYSLPGGPDVVQAPGNKVSLLEGGYKYRFSFRETSERSGEWSTHWQNHDRLPALIKFEINDARTGRYVLPPFIIRLRHDVEQDCLSKKPQSCTLDSSNILSEAPLKGDKKGGENL